MRRITETFILCCAAALLCIILTGPCFAQPITPGKKPITPTDKNVFHSTTKKANGNSAAGVKIFIENQELTKELKKMHFSDVQIDSLITTEKPPVINSVLRITKSRFIKSGFVPIKAKKIPPSNITVRSLVNPQVAGTTWDVGGKLPGVNVSSDDGGCSTTSSPACTFNIPVQSGLRTLTFSKEGFYADPWQHDVQTDISNINVTMEEPTTGCALIGQLTNVNRPSTVKCIEVTLSQVGTCASDVRSIWASDGNDFKFSFENIDCGITYKVAVTNPLCSTAVEISRTYLISGTQNCIFNGLNCQ